MSYVMVDTEVQVNMRDFSTEELLKELEERGESYIENIDGAIEAIGRAGAPDELMRQLREWNRPAGDPRWWWNWCGVMWPLVGK